MTAVSQSAKKKIKAGSFSLNRFGTGTQSVFHLVLAAFSLMCIIPFIFVIIIAFSSEESIRQIGYSFAPLSWSTQAFTYTFQLGNALWRSYFNSFLITAVGTLLSVSITVLYAYPLFRRDYRFRNFFNFLSFFTMIFGGGLVPTFVICKSVLGLSDNYAALIVPMLFSPFNVIIMRTFLQTTVPTELIEAATIDGSGEYSTLLLLMRMQRNADFLAKNSSMLGADAAKAAAQLPSQSLKMALVVFIVVPIACAYPFFQRYVVAGLTIGSVKG